MNVPVGPRDKRMNEIASIAAEAFCQQHLDTPNKEIAASPNTYLPYAIPYLTVRTLQRQEELLKSNEAALSGLEADSRRIKNLTFWIGAFAFVTLLLTGVLAYYAWRLDKVMDSFGQRPTLPVESTALPTHKASGAHLPKALGKTAMPTKLAPGSSASRHP